MSRIDELGMAVAHAAAMKQAAIAAHNKNARDYWAGCHERLAAQLSQELRKHGYDKPAPTQLPLFVDDLKGQVRPLRKR